MELRELQRRVQLEQKVCAFYMILFHSRTIYQVKQVVFVKQQVKDVCLDTSFKPAASPGTGTKTAAGSDVTILWYRGKMLIFGTLFLTCQSDQDQLYVNEKTDCKSERNIENMENITIKLRKKSFLI